MFLIFGVAITLASFLLANALVSLAVAAVAPAVIPRLPSDRLRLRTRVLLGLRLLPAAAAATVAAGLVVPAYLLLEPADSGERVTVPLALLASAALAILLHGVARGAARSRRHRAARARVAGGSGAGHAARLPRARLPCPRRRCRSSPWWAGAARACYVSARVLHALTPAELAAAVAHERAHVGAADNLKRLLIRSTPDLLVLSRASRALDEEWGHAAEAIADERATGGDRHMALALAAGLVKVARLGPRPPPGYP